MRFMSRMEGKGALPSLSQKPAADEADGGEFHILPWYGDEDTGYDFTDGIDCGFVDGATPPTVETLLAKLADPASWDLAGVDIEGKPWLAFEKILESGELSESYGATGDEAWQAIHDWALGAGIDLPMDDRPAVSDPVDLTGNGGGFVGIEPWLMGPDAPYVGW